MRTPLRGLLVLSLVATTLLALAGSAGAGGDHHGPPRGPGPDAVLSWNVTMTNAARECGLTPDGNPLVETRVYAMTQIAIHDALAAIRPKYQAYAYHPAALSPGASPEAAVAAAANGVLSQELGNCPGAATVAAAYAGALAAIPPGAAKNAGVATGAAAAAAIRSQRAGDGAAQVVMVTEAPPFVEGTAPGQWRFTPERPFAFGATWGSVQPFALQSSEQFAPTAPYALDSRAYARDLKEVQRLGGDGVTTPSKRTPDQTEIALYWVNSSPMQWNSIARTITQDRRSIDLWAAARLFGVLNIAMADGYIGAFDAKFDNPQTRLFWRPVTAIRLADTDSNPATKADPTWTPLRITPPIPDYDSGHAVQGAVAGAVLAAFFGDRVRFSACSVSLPETNNACAGVPNGDPGVVRQFRSFSQATEENGLSRIYVGFHFRKAVVDGIAHGRQIGNYAFTTTLLPRR